MQSDAIPEACEFLTRAQPPSRLSGSWAASKARRFAVTDKSSPNTLLPLQDVMIMSHGH